MQLALSVVSAAGTVVATTCGENEVHLVYEAAYTEGDQLVLEASEPGQHLVISLDDALPYAPVFLADTSFALPVPFGKTLLTYSPRSFSGQRHRLTARLAKPQEIQAFRNLTLNPYDHHGNSTLHPHGWANVETRGEAVFAACNAMDGEKANTNHGFWPYTSWGINRDPLAELRISFGRPVTVEALCLYLRADFPHDAWWTDATVSFSDGSDEPLRLDKTGAGQWFPVQPRQVEWVRLHSLIKADDPSPFPALTQLEIWGTG